MSDTSDSAILNLTINDLGFQNRCRLRFIVAAIAITNEVLTLTTNGATAAANNTLHVAATTGVLQGMTPIDTFAPTVIPAATIVETTTATTVVLNANVTGAGVASGDVITFAPANHAAKLQLAGALFSGNVDPKMLALTVIANTTNRTNCLANPSVIGGNIIDSDIDFHVNSIFQGIAMSRGW